MKLLRSKDNSKLLISDGVQHLIISIANNKIPNNKVVTDLLRDSDFPEFNRLELYRLGVIPLDALCKRLDQLENLVLTLKISIDPDSEANNNILEFQNDLGTH